MDTAEACSWHLNHWGTTELRAECPHCGFEERDKVNVVADPPPHVGGYEGGEVSR